MNARIPERLIGSHYGDEQLAAAILAAIEAAGLDPNALTPEQLAPMDQFHPGGRTATLGLATFARLSDAGHCDVLDLGGGIGGPARLLARELGVRVTVLELTEAFVTAGRALTELMGQSEAVRFEHGSGLDMPFPDASFDVVYIQNSLMNISDKSRLFAEVQRVLRPYGRLALQDTALGPVPSVRYPVPWALGPEISFLETPERMRALVDASGLKVVAESRDPDRLLVGLRNRRPGRAEGRKAPPAPKPQLPGLGELRHGSDFWREAVANMLANVQEGRTINYWLVGDRLEESGQDAN